MPPSLSIVPPPILLKRLWVQTIIEKKIMSTKGMEGKYTDVMDTFFYQEFGFFTRSKGSYIPYYVHEYYTDYGELVPKRKKDVSKFSYGQR